MTSPDSVEGPSSTRADRVDSYRIPKIPPFYRNDPELWFKQAEGTLRAANITSGLTKTDSILAGLDYEVAASVRDLLFIDPRPADIFERIKQRIIATYGPSPEANLRKLLKGQVLTDGKPSLVLNRLRNLNNGKCDDAVIRSVFLEHLPSGHRAILASTGLNDLDMLASVADRISETAGPSDHVISAVARPSPSSDSIEHLIKRMSAEIDRLRVDVNKLMRKCSRSASSARRVRSASRGREGPSDKASEPKLCYAHRKYPNTPKSCKPWCDKFESFRSGN